MTIGRTILNFYINPKITYIFILFITKVRLGSKFAMLLLRLNMYDGY